MEMQNAVCALDVDAARASVPGKEKPPLRFTVVNKSSRKSSLVSILWDP